MGEMACSAYRVMSVYSTFRFDRLRGLDMHLRYRKCNMYQCNMYPKPLLRLFFISEHFAFGQRDVRAHVQAGLQPDRVVAPLGYPGYVRQKVELDQMMHSCS